MPTTRHQPVEEFRRLDVVTEAFEHVVAMFCVTSFEHLQTDPCV